MSKAVGARRPTNLSINPSLMEEAKALSINASRAAEEGIARAVSEEKSRRWKEENREAIEDWNKWVEENGLPLARHRMF